ncbi:MAG: shikimate kinase [Spirochaetaceae bacterium]|jgi:shikimate kinase|nr:shikimate kinase [Spirochaetaceae bacterium]
MSGGAFYLILTGPKHSGKTSAGYALQKILGSDFVDIDALIEEREGAPARILYKRGREIFQKAEARAINSLLENTAPDKPLIIAAGGGLIDNEELMAALVQNPLVFLVYLEVSADTAWERIENGALDGGLPAFLDAKNPKEQHAAIHKRRAAAYEKIAHIIINAENKSPRQIAGEIADKPAICLDI